MPWPVTRPFRMRPGLTRLHAPSATHSTLNPAPTHALFLRDALAPTYRAHKAQVLAQEAALTQVGLPHAPTLQAIAQAYERETGVALLAADPALLATRLATEMQEDFVVLHDVLHDGPGGDMRTEFLSVSFPSNWNPQDKLGLDFAAIHQPVADNALLQSGARGIIDMAFRQASMLRHVWLLSPSDNLSQHPATRLQRRATWDTALARAAEEGTTLLAQTTFRVERQTTLPLPELQRGAFFIRVMVCPLLAVLQQAPQRSAELHEAIASMSEAVVAYRGMAEVRERLLAELSHMAAQR